MRRHPVLVSLTIFILFCLSGYCLHAQRSLIRTYTVGDGLVMNRVRGFHQDKDGFIWMYTWDGLSRYEGYRFRNYIAGRDLQHSFVNDILEWPDGSMLLPLNDGSMAEMRNLEIQTEVHMPGAVINDFCLDDEGRIFVATDVGGIQLFENGKLIPIQHSKPIMSIIEIIYHQDHFFFIGPYAGPSGVYDMEMNLVSAWHEGPAFFSSIYKDHLNRIFVCTMGGLKEVDQSNSAFDLKDATMVPQDVPWKNWSISSVVITPDGDAWIGTSQGLVHLRADQSWSVLTVQDGLLSNQVNSLFLDKSNTLWIGTDAGAASINLQTKITDNRKLPGVYSNFILPHKDGSVYVITGYANLSQVDRYMNMVHSTQIGNSANPLQGLIPRQNDLLVVRQSTIEELNATHFPFQQASKAGPGIVYAKLKNKYWIASDYGFYCLSSPGISGQIQDSTYYATTIASARNDQLLIGTIENGVILAKPGNDPNGCSLQRISDFSEWTDDLRIRSLMTTKNGDIWIGTRFSGVVRLVCNDDYSSCTKQVYSMADGLVSNWITSITEDKDGVIWIGSASGIDKLIPRGDKYFVFSFSRVNGYYANVRHLVVHPDGSIWAGHSEGLSRIIDGRIDTIGPPITHITEVSLGGMVHSSLPASMVRLGYQQNSAHFAFAAPDYINSSQLMFTYRLLGSKDTLWSPPVKTHEIFYGNLTPGKFKFEVASFGWNGERSEPVSYAFEIMSPFWKQPWFISLSVLLIGVSVFGLYRFRISQIHHVVAVRDRIAADLHDEIGSSLTHINILSEIGRQQHSQNNGAAGIFERIGSEVQSSSEALDDIIWSVRTRRDAIGDVIARMRQYATEIFEPADIQFQLNESIDGIQTFEMEFKRDFYLVYKELLRNIVKHASASRVDIQIRVDKTHVAMQIRDNGKGFDILAPTERSGLANVKTRVEKWNGKVTWSSGPGLGTEVRIEMKP